ncbi:MAG: HesA/MoeB/ThiF family protein [Bacillota bacterium]|jgi:adenylyltransferase/sulfurtransferase
MNGIQDLTKERLNRYRRNILLNGVGEAGQRKLLSSSVLLVGAGGLGSPAAFYLAAAGTGRIGLVDGDMVDVSNLQRQILHATPDVGRAKVVSARDKLTALNPEISIEAHAEVFSGANAAGLIQSYDFIIDCTDNFQARYYLNKACVDLKKPFVYGGVLAWAGQLFTVLPGAGPCFRCIFRQEPPPGAPGASVVGILGAVAGVIGVLQAAEAVKYLLGVGDLLVGRMLTYDALGAAFFEVPLRRDNNCPDCGGVL